MMNRTAGWLRRRMLTGLAVTLLAAGGSSAQGALVNGSFEFGFTDWETIGNTSLQTSLFGTGPTDGLLQALMTTTPSEDTEPDLELDGSSEQPGDPSVSASAIETFLGIPSGTLDGFATEGSATEGSAIKQTFSANAGEILSFDWNFLTDESFFSEPFNDFSFWTLVTAHNGQVLADTFDPNLVTSPTVFFEETGYSTLEYVVPATGTYTIGFGVMDIIDENFNSALLIDNVQLLASVPEPASAMVWTLFGVCAVVGNAYRRRRRTQ